MELLLGELKVFLSWRAN